MEMIGAWSLNRPGWVESGPENLAWNFSRASSAAVGVPLPRRGEAGNVAAAFGPVLPM